MVFAEIKQTEGKDNVLPNPADLFTQIEEFSLADLANLQPATLFRDDHILEPLALPFGIVPAPTSTVIISEYIAQIINNADTQMP